jgi:hypothetical protein
VVGGGRGAGGRLAKGGPVSKKGGKKGSRGGREAGLDVSAGSSSSVDFLPQDGSSPPSLPSRIIVPETPPSPPVARRAIAPSWNSSSAAAAAVAAAAAAAAAAPPRTMRPSHSSIIICDTPSPLPASGKENFGALGSHPHSKMRGGKWRENGAEVVLVSSDNENSDEDMTLRERVMRMMKKR